MNKGHHLIIIGGGPAGLFAGIQAAKAAKEAGVPFRCLVLEKNREACKKLLISGSGRCNITHAGDIRAFLSHYGDNGAFLKSCLLAFPHSALIDYLEKGGVPVEEMDNGKLFPSSGRSGDIARLLLSDCVSHTVTIQYGSPVSLIERHDDGRGDGGFVLYTGEKTYTSPCVCIAAGGASYPQTGSTGDGFKLAAGLGHAIVPPKPALTPVLIKNYQFAQCAGISLKNSLVSLFRDNGLVKNGRGDVLFTHKGLSGPGILDMSRYMKPGDEIRLNLLGRTRDDAFNAEFIDILRVQGGKSLKNALADFSIPEGLLRTLLVCSGLKGDGKAAELSRTDRTNLLNALFGLSFPIQSLGGYNTAMVTSGGVQCKEVNPKTMESRLVQGLFFAGEVLDIDGDTGGYNLQAAFSTGYSAGRSAAGGALDRQRSAAFNKRCYEK